MAGFANDPTKLDQAQEAISDFERNDDLLRFYRSSKSLQVRNLIVENNMGLVHKIARKYLGTGLAYEDLCQEGVKGLIRAVEKFDSEYGAQFSTYACQWISALIENEVSRNSLSVKVPERTRKLINQLKNKARKLLSEGVPEREINRALAQETGLDERKIEKLMALRAHDVNLDAPAYRDDGQSSSLKDQVEDPRNLEDKVMLEDEMNKLRSLISKLPSQRRMAVEYYHGLNGVDCENFKDVAEHMGVSRQRVNVLYKEGIAQIQEMIRATDRISG